MAHDENLITLETFSLVEFDSCIGISFWWFFLLCVVVVVAGIRVLLMIMMVVVVSIIKI